MGRKLLIVVTLLFSCMIFFQHRAFAQEASLVDLGQPPLKVIDMVVVGETVYVANKSNGLVIFDIRNPAERKTVSIKGGAKRVQVSGDYAYLVNGNNELVVIDLKPGNTQDSPNLNIWH